MQVCTIAAGNTPATGVRQPLQAVADDEEHIDHAAVLDVGQHTHPELRRLARTVAGPQPEHVPVPVQVDPDRGVERLVADLPVTNLDHDRVDEDRRIDPLQRPGGPRLHVLDDLVGDPADSVLGHRRPVDLGEVRADLPGGQPARVQREHDRVHIGQGPLPLLDDDRLEAALPVPRHLDLHRGRRCRSTPSWPGSRCASSPRYGPARRACRSRRARSSPPRGRPR